VPRFEIPPWWLGRLVSRCSPMKRFPELENEANRLPEPPLSGPRCE
jgi:hypothetical protein